MPLFAVRQQQLCKSWNIKLMTISSNPLTSKAIGYFETVKSEIPPIQVSIALFWVWMGAVGGLWVLGSYFPCHAQCPPVCFLTPTKLPLRGNRLALTQCESKINSTNTQVYIHTHCAGYIHKVTKCGHMYT